MTKMCRRRAVMGIGFVIRRWGVGAFRWFVGDSGWWWLRNAFRAQGRVLWEVDTPTFGRIAE